MLLPEPRHARWTGRRVAAAEPRVHRVGDLPPEGYRLRIGDSGVEMDAASAAAEFYGRQTLVQLTRTGDGRLPEGDVEDWPDLPVRGVMIDVSRDKVPELPTLYALIDRLAEWKVNQVQLYMEHTFAYAGHEEVWAGASPYTAADVAALDTYCRERHIELVPNQNCLGHWERWLAHDRYRPLAIHPDGFDFFGRHRGPTTLDPSHPEARRLVASLLEELLPNFGSRRVHLGLDEPWELPDDRFGDYLAWMDWLASLEVMRGREPLAWGDVVISHPAAVGEVPPAFTVCEWGYEAGHPFAERLAAYAEAGRNVWVSPGTSSWLSLVGRWSNMTANVAAAATAAVAAGAGGLLVTDWGDLGHLQYAPVSEPGFAYAAAVSWCAATNVGADLPAAVAAHAFADPTGAIGEVLQELGDVHTALVPQTPNASSLVRHLYRPESRVGVKATSGLTAAQLDDVAARLDRARAGLSRSAIGRDDGPVVVQEIGTAIDLLQVLVADAGHRLAGDLTLAGIPEAVRLGLATRIDGVAAAHRDLWRARNRPGGLDDSVSWLTRLRDAYRTGVAAPR